MVIICTLLSEIQLTTGTIYFFDGRMLHTGIMAHELSFAHKMSLQTLVATSFECPNQVLQSIQCHFLRMNSFTVFKSPFS